MKSIKEDYQEKRIKRNQKFLLKLLHLHIRKWLGIGDYIKWLFRKPEIFFNKELSGKEVIKAIKEQNLYKLKNILPRYMFGSKQLSRKQSLLFLGGALILGIVGSFIFNNPILFLIGLGIAYGSVYAFNEANTGHISVSMLDSTHFVVVYRDYGNSNYGTARIGIISDTDVITFGSEYVFNSATTLSISVSALDSTHFVVGFVYWGSGYGGSVVGTVSGTPQDDITFGSVYDFNGAVSNYISVSALDSTHFVVTYKDDGGADYGCSKVGVISDTDVISYGSEYPFNSAVTDYTSVSALDSTHFVVAYVDAGNSNKPTSIIGTVSSGDQIAFGSEYVIITNSSTYIRVSALDATHFVVGYENGTLSKGQAVIGIISATDVITFGSVYNFSETDCNYISISLLDPTHFVVVYKDISDDYGKAIIGTVSGTPQDDIAFGDIGNFNEALTAFIDVSALDSTHFVVAYKDDGGADYGEAVIGTYTVPQELYKTCPETISIVPIDFYSTSKIIAEIVQIVGSKLNEITKVFIESLNIMPVIEKVATLARILIETIKIVPTITKTLTAARTLTENVIIVPVYSGVLTAYKTLIESVQAIGSILRDAGRTLSDILIIGDLPTDIASIFFKALTEVIQVVSAIGNSIARVFIETIQTVGSLLNQATLYKVLTEIVQATGQIVQNVGRIFIEVFTTSLVFSTTATLLKTLTEIVKTAGDIINQTARIFIETIIVGVVFQTVLTAYKTLIEVVKVVSSRLGEIARTFVENIVAISNLAHLHNRNLLERIAVLPVLGSFTIGKLLIQPIKIIEDLLFSTTRVFTETINIIGQRIFILSRNLLETVIVTIQQFNFSLAKTFNETVIVQWFKETYRAFVYVERIIIATISIPFVIAKTFIENAVAGTDLLFRKTQYTVLTDVVKVGINFVRTIARIFIENIRLASDVIIKYMGRLFDERIYFKGGDTLVLLYGRVLTETVSIVKTFGNFVIGKLLLEVIKVYDSVAKASAWLMTETIRIVSNMLLLSGKLLAEVFNIIPSKIVDIGRIFTQNVKIGDIIHFRHFFYQILTESIKAVSVLIRTTGRTLKESIVIVGSMGSWVIGKLFIQPLKVLDTNVNVWQLGRLFSEIVKVTGSAVSQSIRVFTEVLNISGTFILGTISKVLIEIVKISFVITKSLPKVFTESIKIVGGVITQGVKIFIETIAVGGQFILGTISKLIIEIVKIVETYSKVWTLSRVFTETIQIVVSALVESGKVLTEIVSVVGSFVLGTISKLLIEIVVIEQTVIATIVRVFSEAINISVNIVNRAGKIFIEVVSVVSAMGNFVIGKLFTEVVIIGETFIRVTSRIFTQSLTVIGEIYRLGSEYIFYETIEVVGSRVVAIGRTLSEVISVGWAKIKLVLNGIQVGLWKKIARVTNGVWRKISRNDN